MDSMRSLSYTYYVSNQALLAGPQSAAVHLQSRLIESLCAAQIADLTRLHNQPAPDVRGVDSLVTSK